MKNFQQKLESFANSTYNSSDENEFMEDTMSTYYDEKLKRKYASVLEVDYSVVKETTTKKPAKKNYVTKLLIIIAAAIALLTAAFFLTKINKEPAVNYQVASTIDDAYYTEIDFSTRGAVNDAVKLVEISQFYELKEYAQVSSIYSSLESLDIEGNYLHAIGVSLANNNELDEAIKVWNILLETEESKFTYHNVSRWFMGRAMIESGKYVEQGKEILSAVTSESKYYSNAQDLLLKNK